MQFDIANVKTTVEAEKENIRAGMFGYFSNDLQSLMLAVNKEKSNTKSTYDRLKLIQDNSHEKRFLSDYSGYFSLFYPTDDFENINRY